MKKFMLLVSVLILLLAFGFTTNYADASTDVSKTIQELKAKVKGLTQTNKEKDKKIAQLEKLNKSNEKKIKRLYDQKAEVSRISSKKSGIIRQYEMENRWKIESTIDLLIDNAAKGYNNPPQVQPIDIKINSNRFHDQDIEKHVTDQEFKEIVVRSVRNRYYQYVKVISVTIELPTRNLVIKIDESI
ncbi:hypothetical protein [Rummeliibacillus stabekisii]|uniref:hypothetical protein n=1 Tax=Rummeliibacillus stabekisii TaxID=241244 RepID=UPI00116E77B0|nr:hypothetical protein [Rummeliibacillus stabekisii]MBB5171550.1 Sec-independent protein translocase protein TatA [Rummeliibacillus stabekisii]GEL05518.1 hypothetical protein RST01_21450 [Rummeliibacillus stabekisii]